jgi:serine/threonine protein kinase
MSPKPCYCINPACKRPDHPDNNNPHTRYCLSCGSQLLLNDQFRVSRLLSDDSGFGNVYEAFQGFSAKILKVLKPEWNSQPKAIELFKQEYAVLKELSQQGVRGIPQAESYFEYPTKSGLKLYCLVMEKVEGIDLVQWLKNNGKVNQTQALKWLREIVLILDKIHRKKYFHRDIKPPNIMMRNNGELVLIDFGTAREETQTYYQKVQGGQVTGISSVGYTPIEQQHGQAVAPSDFFALGRTFVHLLTGKHPSDPSMYDPMRDVLNWRGHTENINPLLLDLIEGLMARLAANRPQNTQVILQRLDRLEQINYTKISLAQTLTGHSSSVASVAFSPDGKVLASGSWDGTTKLWEVKTGREINTLNGHSRRGLFDSFHFDSVNSVAFSPDGKVLASGSGYRDKTIKLWEVKTGREINSLTGHSTTVNSVAFSPDGQVLASGSGDNTIKLWEVKTGREINTLSGHSYSVHSVAFSPDGKVLASGSNNNIKLWEVKTGREINDLSGHSHAVVSVAFSPDGKVLASGSNNNIKLWEVKTGREIKTLTGYSHYVESVAFSPDGQVLASGSDDKTIKLWEVKTGREIKTLNGHSDFVESVAFSPDGQVLASGSRDNTIKLWRVRN